MQTTARESYLATEVMTAPPQKLQLLLIEGAIRFCNLTLARWEQGDQEAAGEALTRAQGIITELIAGVRPEHNRELARKATSVYLYLFRTLVDAHLKHDAGMVRDALRVLDIERGTWQEVCRRLAGATPAPLAMLPADYTPLGDLSA